MASEGDEAVTIAGVGSLLSPASARESFDFSNFRLGEVRGWRRCFCQANWVTVVCGASRLETNEVAALAMVPEPDFVSQVALLDVPRGELPGFYERETGYRIVNTPFSSLGRDPPQTGCALLCVACKDDAEADRLWAPGGELQKLCMDVDYVSRWLQLSLRPLWPAPEAMPLSPGETESVQESLDTVDEEALPRGLVPGRGLYPAPGYLRDCAQAHDAAGLLDHFLDSTLLADRRTSLRAYLAANPVLAAYVTRRVDGVSP